MKNEIQTYEKMNDLPSVQALGGAISESGMFGCNKPEQGIIIALQCIAENKPPLEMAKNYHLVKGKLTKRADSMLADFKKSGGKIKWADLKNRAIQSGTFTDPDGNVYNVSYSIDDAKAAGVYNSKADSPWQKTPAAMMRARLVSETLRAIAPEIVTGVYTPEEAAQFDDVQPAKFTESNNPVITVTGDNNSVDDLKKIDGVVTEKSIINARRLDAINPQPDTRQQLEHLIFDAKAEDQVNAYFEQKGALDQLIGSTWRDLDFPKLQHLLDNWDSFKTAVLNK